MAIFNSKLLVHQRVKSVIVLLVRVLHGECTTKLSSHRLPASERKSVIWHGSVQFSIIPSASQQFLWPAPFKVLLVPENDHLVCRRHNFLRTTDPLDPVAATLGAHWEVVVFRSFWLATFGNLDDWKVLKCSTSWNSHHRALRCSRGTGSAFTPGGLK